MRGLYFLLYIHVMEERVEELRKLIYQYTSYVFVAEELIREAEDELRSINEAIKYQQSSEDY